MSGASPDHRLVTQSICLTVLLVQVTISGTTQLLFGTQYHCVVDVCAYPDLKTPPIKTRSQPHAAAILPIVTIELAGPCKTGRHRRRMSRGIINCHHWLLPQANKRSASSPYAITSCSPFRESGKPRHHRMVRFSQRRGGIPPPRVTRPSRRRSWQLVWHGREWCDELGIDGDDIAAVASHPRRLHTLALSVLK